MPDEPALLLAEPQRSAKPLLIVADLHLGLGATMAHPGGVPPTSERDLAERLLRIARTVRAGGILVDGDVKHPIVGTPPSLRRPVFDFFATVLAAGYGAEVVLGNHDVGLARFLPREVEVHPPAGIVRSGVGLFHGHRWPSPEVLTASRLVTGHLHPGFRFAPTTLDPVAKRRCWVRAELPEIAAPKRPPTHAIAAREVIVLPAFNPVAGTEALNRERPARGRSFLFGRFLSRGRVRAYLMDGTDLGPIPTW